MGVGVGSGAVVWGWGWGEGLYFGGGVIVHAGPTSAAA